MESKETIRERILQMRKRAPELSLREMSGIICKKLTTLPEYKQAKSIYTYVSFAGEVSTFPLIEAAWMDGKTVAVPRVIGSDTLQFIELTTWDQLEEGYFHVLEPVSGQRASDEEALLVMPGVAFDLMRHRIGYGKGFYDRYLSEHPSHTTAALSFDFALLASIPAEEHDRTPQIIVTEKRILSADDTRREV